VTDSTLPWPDPHCGEQRARRKCPGPHRERPHSHRERHPSHQT
jgi:hypothetical protein